MFEKLRRRISTGMSPWDESVNEIMNDIQMGRRRSTPGESSRETAVRETRAIFNARKKLKKL